MKNLLLLRLHSECISVEQVDAFSKFGNTLFKSKVLANVFQVDIDILNR